MTLSYLAHRNLPPNRSVGWSISAFAVQLLVFELKILEIFESEIRQNILDYLIIISGCWGIVTTAAADHMAWRRRRHYYAN